MTYFCFILLSRNNGGAVYSTNRICFGVSLRSISKHTRDFSLKYFDEFKFFSLKRLKIDDFLNEKKQKFLERRPSKINLFCKKKKQDFSAAKTPHSKVEVNLFYKDILHHWITYLKKKEIKNAQTDKPYTSYSRTIL